MKARTTVPSARMVVRRQAMMWRVSAVASQVLVWLRQVLSALVPIPHHKRATVRWQHPLDRTHHQNRHHNRLHPMCTIRSNRQSLPRLRQRTAVMAIPLDAYRKTTTMMMMTTSVNRPRRRQCPGAINIQGQHPMVS
uniref:Putative secreted protein n=1 Tax=Anopheles marajoara TaxID=58244 RepID=A0A2M4C6Y4_9DIPT